MTNNAMKSAIDVFERTASARTVPGFSNTATAGIFATYPAHFMTRTGEFFSEFIATAILFIGIVSLADKKHGAGNLMPLGLLFLVFGIGLAFGSGTGYAMNPARDFAPRFFTYLAGYGTNVWKASGHYFWVNFLFLICTSRNCTHANSLLDSGGRPMFRCAVRRIHV